MYLSPQNCPGGLEKILRYRYVSEGDADQVSSEYISLSTPNRLSAASTNLSSEHLQLSPHGDARAPLSILKKHGAGDEPSTPSSSKKETVSISDEVVVIDGLVGYEEQFSYIECRDDGKQGEDEVASENVQNSTNGANDDESLMVNSSLLRPDADSKLFDNNGTKSLDDGNLKVALNSNSDAS